MNTEHLLLPIEETGGIIEAVEQAAKAGDLPALQWCGRRLQWLYENAETTDYDNGSAYMSLFSKTWKALSKDDSPPESIAAMPKIKALI